jgi:hypothetical protein
LLLAMLDLLDRATQLLYVDPQFIVGRDTLGQLAPHIELALFRQREAVTERLQTATDFLVALTALAFQSRNIGAQSLKIVLCGTTSQYAGEEHTHQYEQSSHGDPSSYWLIMAKWARRLRAHASSLCLGSSGNSSP